MAEFISKQPNGLYCRFSTIVGCPTDWNMTEEDYIEICKERAAEEAKRTLANKLYSFEKVKENFYPGEMTQEEFDAFLTECSTLPSNQNATEQSKENTREDLPLGYIGCLRCGAIFEAHKDHCPGCMQSRY